MSQLDEIDMELDLNTDKQYFFENQMEVVASKVPIKDFYGQNDKIIWSREKITLVDEFCINKGETLEFFARLTIDTANEENIGESELQLEVEGKGTVSFSREKISSTKFGDMTLYFKHTFDHDATVAVNFDPKISGDNRVTILPRAFQYGVKVFDVGYSLDSKAPLCDALPAAPSSSEDDESDE